MTIEQQLLEANAKIERLSSFITSSIYDASEQLRMRGESILNESPAQSLALHDADVIDYIHDEIIDGCETAEECKQEIVNYTIRLRNSFKEGD